jgi:hypothetical protein
MLGCTSCSTRRTWRWSRLNPLAILTDGNLAVLDGKINSDDNANFRHPKLVAMRDISQEDETEVLPPARPQLRDHGRQHRLHGQRRRPRDGHHGRDQAGTAASRRTSSTSAAAPTRSASPRRSS